MRRCEKMPKQTFLNLPEDKKQKILEAAKNEFSRVSVTEASINNIVTEANIARGSFYQYFESKEDLLIFMIDKASERVKDKVNEKIKENGDIFETFIFFYDKIVETCKDSNNKMFYKTVLANLRANDSIVLGKAKEEIYNSLIKNTDTSNFKSKKDLPILIEMLSAITRWAIIQTVTSNNVVDIREKYIKQIEYVKNGIVKS